MGDYARAFGIWARALRANQPAMVQQAFDAMAAAPARYQPGWDGVDDFALYFNDRLTDAIRGRDLARAQIADAQVAAEQAIAQAHEREWVGLHDELVRGSATIF